MYHLCLQVQHSDVKYRVERQREIENERIRGTVKVGEISKNVQESRLKWHGHVLRREEEYVGKRVVVMEVPGEMKERKAKAEDNIRNDLSEREMSGKEAQDRAKWWRHFSSSLMVHHSKLNIVMYRNG